MTSETSSDTAPWLRNCWYQAAWLNELGTDGLVERTILDRPLLLFRDANGASKAILNRCPHRFAPLSAGSIKSGIVRCGYHGLAFDGSGRCVDNPHGAITSALCVPAFPAVERHQAIWVWMGSGPADPSGIPDLSFIDETPETARIYGYLPTAANYQLLTDNIMDLSHADYLHPTSLGGMMTNAKSSTKEQNGEVTVDWLSESCVPPPAFYSMVPPPSRADIWTQVIWNAPAVMVLGTGATEAGTPRSLTNVAITLHNMTPAGVTSSHYFFCSTRKFKVDDAQFNSMIGELITNAFRTEDKPMLEKQQASMGTPDLFSLKPVLLNIDAGAVRARRILRRLIELEAQAGMARTTGLPTEESV
jgi:phenylpropionate dioxygenase-like ring-hydroxylating dioxygenase large terminal subunit